jgi:hypothetical protein
MSFSHGLQLRENMVKNKGYIELLKTVYKRALRLYPISNTGP